VATGVSFAVASMLLGFGRAEEPVEDEAAQPDAARAPVAAGA